MTPVLTTDHIANGIGATWLALVAAVLWRIGRKRLR